MKAYTPGGKFDADFEQKDIIAGIDADLKNPVGTNALWYIYDPAATQVDPIYDVGADPLSYVGGRQWKGPFSIPVVRALWKQGSVDTSAVGYYNSDNLHLTFNLKDVLAVDPNVVGNPDLQNRGRIVWKNQVYRPSYVQERGIISETYTLLVVDCIQVMPEEMVNDPQFAIYASPGAGYGEGTYGYGFYGG
jgi:hypothetical protein